MRLGILAIASLAMVLGCSGDGGTAAPPPTGPPRKEWSQMTKQEKIDTINKQAIPEQAKKEALDRINKGID